MKIFIISLTYLVVYSVVFSQSGWIQQTSGINTSLRSLYFINAGTGWIVGDSGKILHTINGGAIWVLQNSNTTRPISKVIFTDANSGIALGKYYEYNPWCQQGVISLSTTNGGTSWTIDYDGLSSSVITDITRIENNIYSSRSGTDIQCIGTIGSIAMTTNNGLNWAPFYTASNFSYAYNSISFINNQTGWAAGEQSSDVGYKRLKIIRTTDGGSNWEYVLRDSSTYYINPYTSLRFLNSNTGYVFNRSLLKSINGGVNWYRTDSLLTSDISSYQFINTDTGWCAGSNGKIIRTDNGGMNWIFQNTYIGNYLSSIQFLNAQTGYAVGNGGLILKTITGGLTSINQPITLLPNSFILEQNFPNPFNPSTNIGYQLRSSGFITLKIFDARGKELLTLVNKKQDAGKYQVSVNTEALASGIYFYSLFANGSWMGTRKMVLIR